MKIEQLLVQHFYNCKEVTLQGMGTLTLSPDFVMPKENDKEADIPDNAITFQYNSRATADEDLISFIVEQTRKMKALAAADLDSYLVLGKQFLNIGKPFTIEGIGMLLKNQQGELEFTKGHLFNSKIENSASALKEKKEDTEISFASNSRPAPTNKKGLLLSILIIGLGLIGTSVWYFLFRNEKPEVKQNTEIIIAPEIPKVDSAKIDSTASIKTGAVSPGDGYTFKVVFMITADSVAAVNRMNVLTFRGHKIIMSKRDSLKYQLAEPFNLPLSDTTHVKDSLNSFYYLGKGFIELN